MPATATHLAPVRAAIDDSIARSRVFGDVSVPDCLRFQELHTRHHRLQLPTA